MICKEEICAVFRDLHSAERIDLLCTMLQLCVPWELRFLGSCVEELARKDYNSLSEIERRANDPVSLKNLKDTDCDVLTDCKMSSTLNIYLSLMHSDNTTCAHALFGILSRLERTVESHFNAKLTVCSSDGYTFDSASATFCNDVVMDLTLLFTLASYHPAFTFSQRQQLYTMCRNIEKLLNYQSSFTVGGNSTFKMKISFSWLYNWNIIYVGWCPVLLNTELAS
jgi:hypothetical protein